ncbi:MAG TPA: DMT family transporter [Propionibacteriaceae bacterium]|nr:DMT family transporter [Propionibacteriaceae bacterium]
MVTTEGVRSEPRAPVRGTGLGGLGFALLSASSFGLSGVLGKGLLETGWTAGAAVLLRVTVAALVLLVPTAVALRGHWGALRRHAWLVVAFGLVPVAGTQFCFFQAVTRLPVGIALLLEYTAPLVIIVWLWLRHGHRPSRLTVLGAVVAIAGLLLVLDIVTGQAVDLVGALWALAGMVGAATYFVLGAHDAAGLPPIALAGGGMVVGAAGLAVGGLTGLVPMAFRTSQVVLGGQLLPWWVDVLALGLVTAAVAYATGIAASRRLGSRLASFIALTEVLFALVFAWLLLGELPRPVQLLGGLVLVVGVVVVKLGEGRAVDASPEPLA